MVYYNVTPTAKKKRAVLTRMDSSELTVNAGSISPLRSDMPPLSPLNKKALYNVLKKISGKLTESPEIQLNCVEKATSALEDINTFHQWLEKSFYMVFPESEVKGLYEYIQLHTWGPIVVKDITLVSKMFEVPTPLNYSSWYSNIDNMQIRSQFRNSVLHPQRNHASVVSPVKTSYTSPERIIRQPEKTERAIIAKDPSRLEALQQRYLTRSSTTFTSSADTIETHKKVYRNAPGLAARPLPKLAERKINSFLPSPFKRTISDRRINLYDVNQNLPDLNAQQASPSSRGPVASVYKKLVRGKENIRKEDLINKDVVSMPSPSSEKVNPSIAISRNLPPSPIRRPDVDIAHHEGKHMRHAQKSISMSVQIPRVSGM